jgi:hypothetical protein
MRTQGSRRNFRIALAMFCAGLGIGAGQALAGPGPDREARNFCPDVQVCMPVCGEAGGIYYGLMPNGQPLCDCCAPEF